ncbi:unnamed protein product [Phaeothamnion confervicola]
MQPQGLQPNKIQKLQIQARNIVKHKQVVKFEEVDGDDDQNYTAASERFIELQTQLNFILQHAQSFRQKMEEAVDVAILLADDFGRMSQAADRVNEGWAATAHGQAYNHKHMLEECLEAVKQHLGTELDDKSLSTLQAEAERFANVKLQMKERYLKKVEVQHYSTKLQDLKEKIETQLASKPKVTEEKFERNKEKYATATQHLRDQTNQLMSTYAHAETLRRRILTEDLPAMVQLQKAVFDACAANVGRAAHGLPEFSPTPIGARLAASHRGFATGDSSAGGYGAPALSERMAEVSLDDSGSPPRPPSSAYNSRAGSSKMEASPLRDHSYGGGGITAKKTPPSHAGGDERRGSSGSGASPSLAGEATGGYSDRQSGRSLGCSEAAAAGAATGGASSVGTASVSPDRLGAINGATNGGDGNSSTAAVAALTPVSSPGGGGGGVSVAAMPPLPPGQIYLRAVFDYDATQEGDLSFKMNDLIAVDENEYIGDGWVSGRLGDNSGMFPANYCEKA